MYKIGELSKLCNLPVKTLRFYDSEGLLIPDETDKFTGYRYYSAERLADCNRIIALKEMGFSLNEIKLQMQSGNSENILLMIDEKCAEMKTSIKHIESQMRKLDSIKKIIAEGDRTMFDIIVASTDVLKIAFIRKIFESKEEAFLQILQIKELIPKSIIGKRFVIINNETEYKTSNLDLSVGVEITGDLPEGSGLMIASPLPYDCAKLICKACELESAYQAMIERMNFLRYQIIGSFTEIYYEDETVELKVPVNKLSEEVINCNHNTVLPFENDSDVIGKWMFVDKVPSEEQFYYGNPKYSDMDNIWLKELYFLPQGEGYWVIDGWTKGSFTTSFGYPKQTCYQRYSLKTQNGKKLMFIEMSDDSYLFSHGGKPEIYVFEKVTDKAYSKSDIRIYDNTDMPFVVDNDVVGKWKVKDYVDAPDTFNPDIQKFPLEGLFAKSIIFEKDGRAISQYGETPTYHQTWTKGFLIDEHNSISEAYSIREINGKKYLLVEWKSGDYQFGGRKPGWYVFTKV